MANHVPRRSSKNRATIAIDLRNGGDGIGDQADYYDLEDIARVVMLFEDLAGPEAKFFCDFGVISITEVDLEGLAMRLKEVEV